MGEPFVRKVLVAIAFFVVFPLLLAQQTLNNESIIKMVKMGFTEDTIVGQINRSPGTYDTSPAGLTALKNAGVGDKAVAAMVAKPSVVRPAPARSVPVSEVAPTGTQATSQRTVPVLANPAKQAANSPQRLQVRIIDRQDKEDGYEYAAVYNNVAVGKTFKVYGATFTLQLPDGRLTIVNCESKFAEHMAGRVGNRRSCRTPLVDSIEADFNGDKAKLIWPVSLDGRKMQSETYKILGILDRPNIK
jgi:hypothetical protein